MATQAFHNWELAGRPFRLARPIAQLADQVLDHPDLTLVGTLGDESHLTDPTPEDHTPFSIDEWPVSIDGFVVTAIDIGGPPEVVGEAAQRLLAERPFWLKYLIWRGPVGAVGLRDRRFDFKAQEGSGHTTHMHVSIRADAIDDSIGDYELTGDDMNRDEVRAEVIKGIHAAFGAAARRDTATGRQLGDFIAKLLDRALVPVDAALERVAAEAGVSPAELEEIKRAARQGVEASVPAAIADAMAEQLGDQPPPAPPT